MMNSNLIIFPHKAFRAAASVSSSGALVGKDGQPISGGLRFPGIDAIRQSYATDAHCACYEIPGSGSGPHPRLSRHVLPALIAQGLEPVLNWALVDIDNPAHQPWENAEQARKEAERAIGICADLSLSTAYATRSGLRLCWCLDEPVPVSGASTAFSGLFLELEARGLSVDWACGQWHRLFRLPRVNREGTQQNLPLYIRDEQHGFSRIQ